MGLCVNTDAPPEQTQQLKAAEVEKQDQAQHP
jgi:hypothetical protein